MMFQRIRNALAILKAMDETIEFGKPQTHKFTYRGETGYMWIGIGTNAKTVTDRLYELSKENAELKYRLTPKEPQ